MISFVYFDLGGVVIRDFSGTNNWKEMKRALGVKKKFDKEYDLFWDKWEPTVCRGKDLESLKPEISKRFGVDFPNDYSLLWDFVNRFSKNTGIWKIIKDIANRHGVGLLTDMYPGMLKAIYDKGLMPDIEWDVVVDSSVVGYQKPDREIYEYAEKLAGTSGDKILFVDNTIVNLEVAKEFGWKTFHYDPVKVADSNKKLASWKDL